MPTEAKNISKALRHFIREGETDYKGRMLYEYDFEDPWTYVKVMGEAAGFPQHSGVVLREKQFQKRDLVKYWDLAAKKVYDDHYFLRNSVRDGWGKEEDLERFMDEGLKSYNDAVPFNSLKLSPKDLIKSFIARKEGERTEDLKGTTRKKFTPLARTVDEVYEEKLEDIQK